MPVLDAQTAIGDLMVGADSRIMAVSGHAHSTMTQSRIRSIRSRELW